MKKIIIKDKADLGATEAMRVATSAIASMVRHGWERLEFTETTPLNPDLSISVRNNIQSITITINQI